MFERYTEKARRVIFFARYEASQYGSPSIEPEHMLLGLMREARPLFESLMATVDSTKLQAEVRDGLEPNREISTSVDLPLSRVARLVLASAGEEAERAGQKHIDTIHLLHGLTVVPSSAANALRNRGLTIEDLRKKPAEGRGWPRQEPAQILDELRREFLPMARRLTPEIEPATVFRLAHGGKDTGS
jgi:ATP-dependent Clp protease ATP-binding subunit ClpC